MALRADDVDLARDRSLVELAQGGDDAAFEDLYRRYHRRLFRYCLRRVGDTHEAEEIVQEAFARAVVALPRFAGERRFYPWLTVIASRLCVDTHRRRARSEPSADIDLGSVEADHERRLIEADDRRILMSALDRLGPRHREVLHLREDLGMTYQAIADRYEVSIGTVEALLWRARKALRREYLAVTGADARLIGLPVVGWVVRRWVNLRARLEPFTNAAPLLAGGAAASVVLVGGLIVPHAQPPTGTGGGATATPFAPATVDAGAPAPVAPSHAVAVAVAPASADTVPQGTRTQVGNVVISERPQDRKWAEDAPLTATLPVVGTFGVDAPATGEVNLAHLGGMP